MTSRVTNGAELLWATLARLGVEHAFGVPGSQNILLYDALRRSSVRSILTSHELGASFAANGYFRASGKVAALVTIPGPGFTYAIPGLAEAQHDSAAVLHVVGEPATSPGNRYQFQAVDQLAIARPLVKLVQQIERAADIPAVVSEAYHTAVSGEPGPVVLQWSAGALTDAVPSSQAGRLVPHDQPQDESPLEGSLDAVARRLACWRRPLLFVGQGAAGCGPLVTVLAEALNALVLSTASGRGIVPEDHPLALGFDFARGNVEALNELIRLSDGILVLGNKLSHSGTGGFRLDLPRKHTIHVDASRDVIGANYPVDLPVVARTEAFLPRLLAVLEPSPALPRVGWEPAEAAHWRSRLRRLPAGTDAGEPVVDGVSPPSAAGLFALLRTLLPREAIVVTDSGMHQGLVRRHFDVLSPRGLVLPSDFQSMGYGLPAAIGAKLAAPDRPVVAVIGDGAFAMTAMELLTAIREHVALTVLVLNDGRLNQIRLQQQSEFGRSESVDLLNPDFEAFAAALGAGYHRIGPDVESSLRNAIHSTGVTLFEAKVGDSAGMHLSRARGLARETARRALGPGLVRWLKRKLRGG